MRSRRDPFARETLVPVKIQGGKCSWCGQGPQPRHPIYRVVVERDGGRDHMIEGQFCSWGCLDTYHA